MSGSSTERAFVRRLARWLSSRTYPTAKLHHLLGLRLGARNAEPLLVYQMGKVGSQTVWRSLERLRLPYRPFHIHFLTDEGLSREEATYRQHWTSDTKPLYVWSAQYVQRRLESMRAGEKWHVVTLVREPVARNVSDFFQIGLQQLGPEFRRHAVEQESDGSVAALRRLFLERFEGHDIPLTWLDSELHAVLGIDVYASPFPRDAGYAIHDNGRFRLLVLRLENLRSSAPAAFGEFMGLEDFSLFNVNLGETKPYAAVYRRFLNEASLPPAYLSRMYESKYAKHFYTEGELDAFGRKWSGDARALRSDEPGRRSPEAPRGRAA